MQGVASEHAKVRQWGAAEWAGGPRRDASGRRDRARTLHGAVSCACPQAAPASLTLSQKHLFWGLSAPEAGTSQCMTPGTSGQEDLVLGAE